jgi:Putative Flp pilus-assembly TadE/G-like
MIIQNRRSPRRGTVLALVVISLTVLLMVLGYCLDGGLLLTERRKLQAAADAAALAGAADLFLHYPKNNGADSGSAAASAVAIAKANGYENDGSANPQATIETRVFGQKYLGGPKAGQLVERAYIEVTITYHQPRYFSALMGSGPLPVAARAVATGSWGIPKFGMLVLEPSKVGLKLGGNGIVNVTTGMIVVNSTDSGAITNQSNATLQAKEIDITGGLSGAGTITTSPVANNINYGVPPSPDPFSTLPAPSQPATGDSAVPLRDQGQDKHRTNMVSKLVASGQISQAFGDSFLAGSGRLYLVEPGMYDSSNKITANPPGNNDIVVFRQASFGKNGIYYLKDNGFSSTGASLLMDPDDSGGMMFYNAGTGTSDNINITGKDQGVVNLVGMTSGTYQGMIVFQNRSATEAVKITGNGQFNIQGTFYAPNGELNLTGNGSSQTIGSALIGKTVTLGGNGQINIAFSAGNVAPQRILRLTQ